VAQRRELFAKKVKSVLQIGGELGILIRFALYSGLRGEEITYVYNADICGKYRAVVVSSFTPLKKRMVSR
jgi:hypothetical protein